MLLIKQLVLLVNLVLHQKVEEVVALVVLVKVVKCLVVEVKQLHKQHLKLLHKVEVKRHLKQHQKLLQHQRVEVSLNSNKNKILSIERIFCFW
jgi:hypothetical protein